MPILSAAVIASGFAAVAWSMTGAVFSRATNPRRRGIGQALLLGALLSAFDTTFVGHATLPFGPAMLLMAAMQLRFAPRLSHAGQTTWLVATALLMHWLHLLLRDYPAPVGPVPMRLVALATALALGWLALRRTRAGRHRTLLAVTALAAAMLTFAGKFGPTAASITQLLAVGPLLLVAARAHPGMMLHVAAATFGLLLVAHMREIALSSGYRLGVIGVADPLQLTAALFIALLTVRVIGGSAATGASETLDDSRSVGGDKARRDGGTPHADGWLNAGSDDSEAAAAPTVAASLPGTAPSPDDFATRHVDRHGGETLRALRELRVPLTSMLAAIDTVAGVDDERIRTDKQTQLRTFGRELADAMHDVEELQRMLDGDFELVDETFDLHDLLRECTDEANARTSAREIPFSLSIASELPRWQQGDPARTRQLFSRLLAMAGRRSTFGTVEVHATTDGSSVNVQLCNQHSGLEDPDSVHAVFVGELARRLGGSLHVSPIEHDGTRYAVSLPLRQPGQWEVELLADDEQCADEETAHDSAPTLTCDGRVLVVTDNADQQQLFARLVASSGAEVITAETGEMACLLLAEERFDMVLLDMQADANHGPTTARTLRQSAPELPIIALTADVSPAHLELCLLAGCNDHLVKPVRAAALRSAMAMHLMAAQ